MNRESTEFAPLRDGSFARWLARLLVSCLALARYQKHTRTILRPSDLVGMSQNAEFDERILHTALLIQLSSANICSNRICSNPYTEILHDKYLSYSIDEGDRQKHHQGGRSSQSARVYRQRISRLFSTRTQVDSL